MQAVGFAFFDNLAGHFQSLECLAGLALCSQGDGLFQLLRALPPNLGQPSETVAGIPLNYPEGVALRDRGVLSGVANQYDTGFPRQAKHPNHVGRAKRGRLIDHQDRPRLERQGIGQQFRYSDGFRETLLAEDIGCSRRSSWPAKKQVSTEPLPKIREEEMGHQPRLKSDSAAHLRLGGSAAERSRTRGVRRRPHDPCLGVTKKKAIRRRSPLVGESWVYRACRPWHSFIAGAEKRSVSLKIAVPYSR